MADWARTPPLVIDRAEGAYLIDAGGRRYIDGVSSLWVNVHGHGRPEIVEAIRRQAGLVAHSTLLGLTNAPAAELAARLCELSPDGLDKVFYSDSGSTAVEIAMKLAFQYCKQTGTPDKTRFVHLRDSYHGDTLGAVGVGGIGLFHAVYGPLIHPGIEVPNPRLFRDPDGRSPEAIRDWAVRELQKTLDQHGESIAAVVIEPLVQGAAGMLVQPSGYLRAVADSCKAAGVLLIADEVATGFGRTGSMFACSQEGVHPDFLCLAKGITGGTLPLAATLTTNRVYEAFLGKPAELRTFFHGHTYTGNPIACAAALASLDIFREEQVIEGLAPKVAQLAGLVRREFAGSRHLGDARQKGLMLGLELVADTTSNTPFPPSAQVGARVCAAARRHGVLLRPLGDTLVLMPPLSISNAQLETLVSATARAVSDVLDD